MPCPTPTHGSPTYLEWPGWAFDFDGFRLLEAVDGLQVVHAVHQRLAPVHTCQPRTQVDKASTRGPTIYVVLRGNSKRTRLLGCSHSAHSLYGKKLSALHENPSG